jgi:hypothetical protein
MVIFCIALSIVGIKRAIKKRSKEPLPTMKQRRIRAITSQEQKKEQITILEN